jgi:uncharacterized protein (DUF305 family)
MKNLQTNSFMYSFAGILIGGLLVWVLVSSAINNNSTGMMQMMGIRNNNNSSNMSNNIDRHFIEQMIPHHEGAIEMAELALERSNRSEIKTLANSIIKSQSEEIDKMKKWYTSWYVTDVPDNPEVGMGMGRGMMHGGMMGDDVDTEDLKNASDFDKAFLEEMIPHHQMAIMMANMLLQGTNRSEMKQLGQDIIDAQAKEIDQMQTWYKSWYN